MFEKMKGMPLKQKISYLNDYYKWPAIITIAIIAAIVSIVSSYFRYNYNTYLNFTVVNGSFADYKSWEKQLNQEFNLDGHKNRVTFSYGNFTNSADFEVNQSTLQKLVNNFFARSIDVYIGTKDDVEYFSKSNYFFRLDEILTPEKLQELKDKDMVFYAKKLDYTEDEKPYTVEVPVGIYSKSLSKWSDTTLVMDDPVMCFVRNTTNKENIKNFINLYVE